MAVSQGSPTAQVATTPPPPLPNDPKMSNALSNYLMQFSLWCRKNFSNQIRNNVAIPGILLQSTNAPSGVTPNVYMLQVDQDGNITAVQVPLGNPNSP
jgi:hypothetical protein